LERPSEDSASLFLVSSSSVLFLFLVCELTPKETPIPFVPFGQLNEFDRSFLVDKFEIFLDFFFFSRHSPELQSYSAGRTALFSTKGSFPLIALQQGRSIFLVTLSCSSSRRRYPSVAPPCRYLPQESMSVRRPPPFYCFRCFRMSQECYQSPNTF